MNHKTQAKTHRPHLSTATDARAVRTREALRRALLELLTVKPLEQITIRDISAAAGVGYATYFRHHPTKEALLHDIALEQIAYLISLALPVLEAGQTRAASLALCTYVDENRDLWSALLAGGAAGVLREEFVRMTTQTVASRAQLNEWLPAEIAIILIIGSTVELLAWWLRQKKPLPVAQIAEIHDRLIVSPTMNSDETGEWRVAPAPKKQRSPKRPPRKGKPRKSA